MTKMTNAWVWLLLIMTTGFRLPAQEQAMFVTQTTSHWNWDCGDDCNPERWLELEQMWFDEVISKNEYIVASAVYHHYYTGDNSEVLFVNTYRSWEDIEKAQERNMELAEAAWPDEAEREKLADERAKYYQARHSDEIYRSLPNSMPLTDVPEDESLVFYLRQTHLAFPDDGANDEIASMAKEFHSNITHKNKYLQAYYPQRHLWGADGREVLEVFVLKSMADLEMLNEEQMRLIESYWPDEEKRQAFMTAMNKYYTSYHSDRLYRNEPSLQKLASGETE